MNLIKVHPLLVRHHEYEVHIDEHGVFQTIVGVEVVKSNTRDGLKDKLMELTAKAQVRLDIPFVYLNGGGRNGNCARGRVTGLHGGNGNLMVEWTTGWRAGERMQFTPSFGDVIFNGSVTDAEVDAYLELRKASRLAEEQLTDYTRTRKLDLKTLAATQLAEAVSANAGQAG